MSYSPPNYTDGVPIKISEKYKPPQLHHLPNRIQQLASGFSSAPVAFEEYNFDLERKIMSKTSEWLHWRVRERTERQERIRHRDLARLKQLEDEQKQKLNQVSYPSTDDISSCEEDEELANEATNSHIPRDKPFSPTNFNTILMPTQATTMLEPINGKKSHRRYASNSSNKIDFSFFESDASPFDHLEMKSMNEMEVLAQVLAVESESNTNNTLERDNSSESESSDHQKDNNNSAAPQAVQVQQNFVPQSYGNYYGGANPSVFSYGASPVTATGFTQINHHNQFLYPQNYAVNYQYNHFNAIANNNNLVNGNDETKSKSVPSILQELNDELNNSQRRRIRNNSQNSQKDTTVVVEGELRG